MCPKLNFSPGMARPFMFPALCQRAHPLKHSLAESKKKQRKNRQPKFVSRVTRQPRYHCTSIWCVISQNSANLSSLQLDSITTDTLIITQRRLQECLEATDAHYTRKNIQFARNVTQNALRRSGSPDTMPAATHDSSGVQSRLCVSSSKYKNTPRLELSQNALSLGSNVCTQHLNHLRFTWCCLQSSPPIFNLTDCSSCVVSIFNHKILQRRPDLTVILTFLQQTGSYRIYQTSVIYLRSGLRLLFIVYLNPVFLLTFLPSPPAFTYTWSLLFAYFNHIFLPL